MGSLSAGHRSIRPRPERVPVGCRPRWVRRLGSAAPLWLTLPALALLAAIMPERPAHASPVRAAYLYNYMGPDHLDSLAAHGLDRAVIHWITDSLTARTAPQLRAFVTHGTAASVEVVPEWLLQAPARLAALGSTRRYTWGAGTVENEDACPLDSLFWRSALLDRAEEFLAAWPDARRLAVDLELTRGGRHHYDAGPCLERVCIQEYLGSSAEAVQDARRLAGLESYQESRLTHMLTGLLSEFAARHPGVELGVFDLDFDSFVHRAMARALAKCGVPTADYCERSYAGGGDTLSAARSRLNALGLGTSPLIGGVWLKRVAPKDLVSTVHSLTTGADGYFVFTTYSLWQDPAKLTGPYTLPGDPADYWRALLQANRTP